jgi:exopolysaccharide biosynthesis protein
MLRATQALNLDGGNTSAMVFMGEKLNANNNKGPDAYVRSISRMIAIGESLLVPEK